MARTKRTARTTRTARTSTRLAKTVGTFRAALASGAGEARTRAADALSQLEKAFQSRVSTVTTRLGMPKAAEVRALTLQVAQLQQSVDQLRRARARS